jgi:transcriptional regulator with XRE-family HTH domain
VVRVRAGTSRAGPSFYDGHSLKRVNLEVNTFLCYFSRQYNRAREKRLERLRHIREQSGYSQQDLADESGVSQHTISEIELGRRRPQGRTLRKLAKVLGVEVADLWGESDSPLEEAPPSLQAPLFNGADGKTEQERRSLGEAYLVARRQAHKLLHVHRQRIDQLANRWEREGQPTPEELSEEMRHLEGLVEAGLFEIRAPKSLESDALVDTALDEADRFEVEMIRKGVARLRAAAERVLANEEAERMRRTFRLIERAS